MVLYYYFDWLRPPTKRYYYTKHHHHAGTVTVDLTVFSTSSSSSRAILCTSAGTHARTHRVRSFVTSPLPPRRTQHPHAPPQQQQQQGETTQNNQSGEWCTARSPPSYPVSTLTRKECFFGAPQHAACLIQMMRLPITAQDDWVVGAHACICLFPWAGVFAFKKCWEKNVIMFFLLVLLFL